ncbi:MAG: DoxX family protein [Pseudomonadota bacterium]
MILKILNLVETLYDALRAPLLLCVRLVVILYYFPAGIEKIQNYSDNASFMASHGVPVWFLPLVILLETVGSVMIAVGCLTRITATVFAIFTFSADYIFNRGGTGTEAHYVYMAEYTIIAAWLALMAVGAGRWSVDALWRRRVAAASET